eukprot:1685690-Prymnesium_polylepis.1
MPIDQRRRNDATATQMQGGIFADAAVNYFEEIGKKTQGGVGTHAAARRTDTLAMCAPEPYTGPSPPPDERAGGQATRRAAIT